MKRIIDGIRYDTEAAGTVKVARYSDGYLGDFDFVNESLYKSKSGRWFLAGKGGARSNYATSVSVGCWSGGSGIIPMTSEEALAWLEARDFTDEIEEHFGAEVVDA